MVCKKHVHAYINTCTYCVKEKITRIVKITELVLAHTQVPMTTEQAATLAAHIDKELNK